MTRILLPIALFAVGLGICGLTAEPDGSSSASLAKDTRVFELRTYYAAPGKIEALHARFRDHTCKLFEKHHLTIIGFWSPIDEQEALRKLVYLLAFPSQEAAAK